MKETKKWFIYFHKKVMGPSSTKEVQNLAQSTSTKNEIHLWWQGKNEWITYEHWEQMLPYLNNINKKVEKLWQIKVNNIKEKPMDFNELINFCRKIHDHSFVYVWTEGMKDWVSIYTVPKITEVLGITRRKHFRAPMEGKIILSPNNPENNIKITVNAFSISETGMGIKNNSEIKIGQDYRLILKSEKIPIPIKAIVEVVYVSEKGSCGIIFKSLNLESKSAIIEYIRKYQNFLEKRKSAA